MRSGSGQLMTENWNDLTTLWGSCPATTSIPNSRSSFGLLENKESNNFSSDDESNYEVGPTESCRFTIDQSSSQSTSSFSQSTSSSISTSPDFTQDGAKTAKFVGNKRKNLEKQLSANQRDQVFLNIARDEVKLKQAMIDELAESNREANKVFGTLSESIASVGKAIGDEMALMAAAIGSWQQPVAAPLNFSNPMQLSNLPTQNLISQNYNMPQNYNNNYEKLNYDKQSKGM